MAKELVVIFVGLEALWGWVALAKMIGMIY